MVMPSPRRVDLGNEGYVSESFEKGRGRREKPFEMARGRIEPSLEVGVVAGKPPKTLQLFQSLVKQPYRLVLARFKLCHGSYILLSRRFHSTQNDPSAHCKMTRREPRK